MSNCIPHKTMDLIINSSLNNESMLIKGVPVGLTYVEDHYSDVIMSALASQITSPMIVYSTVYSRRGSKKTSKLLVTSLCEEFIGHMTGEFPTQRASNAENVSIRWHHHVGSIVQHTWSKVMTLRRQYVAFPTKPLKDGLISVPPTTKLPSMSSR